jgi:hypothetical protein
MSFQGPLSIPLLGSVFVIDVRNLGKSFKRMGAKYGDIFSIFIGQKPAVILNSYPIIKESSVARYTQLAFKHLRIVQGASKVFF